MGSMRLPTDSAGRLDRDFSVGGRVGTEFWRPDDGSTGSCAVCGLETEYIQLDINWWHPDCDMFPTPQGDVVIIRGRVVSIT